MDRLRRQRRAGRRPGARQRREGLRLDHVPRAPGEGRDLLEDLPGHRRRPGRQRRLGLDRGRLPGQLRRQLPALLRPVPRRPARRSAVRQGPHRHRRPAGRGLLRPAQGGRAGGQAPAGLLDRGTRGLHRAPQLARQLRRLVRLPGAGRAHLQPRGVGEDGAVPHLRRERRLLRPRAAALPGRLRGAGQVHGGHLARRVPGRRRVRGRPLRARPAGSDDRRLALEQGRLRLLRDVRPHLDHSLHRASLRGARAQHLALAARRVRRPHQRLRLLPQGRRDRPAAVHGRLPAAGPRPAPRLRAQAAREPRAAPPGARRQAHPPAEVRTRGGRFGGHRGRHVHPHLRLGRAGRRGLPRHLRQPRRRPLDLHHRGRQDPVRHLELGLLRRRLRPRRARPQRLPARLQGRQQERGPGGDRTVRRRARRTGPHQPGFRRGPAADRGRLRGCPGGGDRAAGRHRAAHRGPHARPPLVRPDRDLGRRPGVRARFRRSRRERAARRQRPGHRDAVNGR
ncbi:putative Xanthine dehydrogenase iron-sulfur subunit / Xanthine dehydrogenase, molybdenum binding subunit [Streptomyces misionensis JCM 4497]